MKITRLLRKLLSRAGGTLLCVALLTACASGPVETPTQQPPTLTSVPASTAPLVPPTSTAEPAQVPVSTPIAAATSRGPELEATDPSTVQLASGGLQLVEFFRFT